MRYLAVSVCLLSLWFGSTGCENNRLQTSEWNPEFAVSLINSEFTLLDVIQSLDESNAFQVDSGQLVHLLYHGTVLSPLGEDWLQLPDLSIPIIDNNAGVIPDVIDQIGFIRELHLKAGKLQVALQTTENQQVSVFMDFPGFLKAGKSLQFDTSLVINGSLILEADLQGYEITSNGNGYPYTLEYSGTSDLFGTLSMTDLAFRYIQGRFDPIVTQTPIDTVDIKLFKSQASGVLRFKDYSMSLHIRNSIGLPLQARFSKLFAKTNFEGFIDIDADSLSTGLPLSYPALSEIGESKESSFRLTEENSNLEEVLIAGPRGIGYQIVGESLPMTADGFLLDSSRYEIDLEVDLPLHLRAENVFLQDTFEVQLSELQEWDFLEKGSLRIQTENGFPAELAMQIYFLDAFGQVSDSLYEDFRQVLVAAAVDNGGRVITPEILNFDVPIPQEKLQHIASATTGVVVFEAVSWNSGQTLVKMFDEYTFALRIGLKASVSP